ALSLLCAVAEKDLRDVQLDVLRDHLQHTPATSFDKHVHVAYVLNPRVSNEMLTPYKAFFQSAFSDRKRKQFAARPEKWVKWCSRQLQTDETWNPQSLCTSPERVYTMRVCDAHSRNIFFVAGARSMGIPARIDEVTGKTQYLAENGKWVDVNFGKEEKPQTPQGTLAATYAPGTFIDNPKYYSHFSLSRIEDGQLQLQNYAETDTWQSLLKDGMKVDAGQYLMVTGTRMADGGVLAHLDFFRVKADSLCQLQYVQRESSERLQVIGSFNSENLFHDLSTGSTRSLLSATGRGYYVIALIAPGNEPTNHFLRDVMPYKDAFEQWGQKLVLLFRDKDEAGRFTNDFPGLPGTIVWGTDIDDKLYNEIVSNMKLTHPNRPIILVADTFNRVVFVSQGYSIGLGEQLVKVIKQLSE
ncbi:MAG: transglutaminase domain-containing protein, partial [Bacteroidaceae bacterium]|nr:transglutaminase domain-containing protein [Bacteroidaceae bacterium]